VRPPVAMAALQARVAPRGAAPQCECRPPV